MDGVDEEVAQLDKVGVVRLQTKENEYSPKTEDVARQELQEGVIAVEVEYHESTTGHVLGDILGGKDVNLSAGSIDGLDRHYMSPRSVDVTGMVEELTVRNYDNLNMAVVGPSRSSERMPPRLSQRQQLHHTAGRSALDCLHGGVANNEENLGRSNLWEDRAGASVSEISPQKPYRDEQTEATPPLSSSENKEMTVKALASGAFRTKILTKSGFSEFFIKNTLKGKGIICRGPPVDNQHIESRNQQSVKVGAGFKIAVDARPISAANTPIPAASKITEARASRPANDGISLRTWLNNGNSGVNKVERLNIFRQIVDLLDCYHSQGMAMPELRPSSFMLLPSNQVKYVGPLEHRNMLESSYDRDMSDSNAMLVIKRSSDYGLRYPLNTTKKQKLNEDVKHSQWVHFHSRTRSNAGNLSVRGMNISELRSNNEHGELKKENDSQESNNWYKSNDHQRHSAITHCQLEDKWYQSPEDQTNGGGSISSNIYCLGVLLFELLGHFDCESTRDAAMMDLRHRILPPHFLLENPKEAGFCLLLLYPDPASRPSSRKILESEVLSGLNDDYSEEMISSIEQDDAESELLLHFLTSLKEQKQKEASKLVDNINCIEADTAEIGRRHSTAQPYPASGSSSKNFTSFDVNRLPSPVSDAGDSQWLGNIKMLETAYFSMRSRLQLPEMDASRRTDNDLLRNRENWQQAQLRDEEHQITTDRVGAFFDGLCKYARHSKFEVRGVLRNGEFNNSVNVICSLSFSRDEDYFAAAGVSKKIKIFEFHGLLNEAVDIHYPVIEMTNRSKLSCVCWNNYIRNYLASTDYDGIVKLWDASTGQGFSEYREHEKRAWSIDFSPVCPTKFASGSDDCSVKLWSISEKSCLGTVRNIANICCVQFSPHSTHLLAFGSADYKTYCYDLRNVRSPWCVLSGHHKAVSYVKFLDAGTIVTASTDNSLKLWDLNKTNPGGLSTNACSLTLTGHTNEKNFVGLSAADGYISCGSETNEVFAYHKSLPMPITYHKFGSIDPISGKETDDDNGQFVSSVCWKGKTDTLIAANSSGCIKVLQMV